VTAQLAAGGGRRVTVAPERLQRWLDGFADRHGAFRAELRQPAADLVTVTADDGAVAEITVPFPPLQVGGGTLTSVGAHAGRDRRIGVLLVRLQRHGAGVFHGSELVASKVDSRPVHGRNRAGGSSSRRFARRRDNQVRDSLDAASAVAARILVPAAGGLDALVVGGDRSAIATVLADLRLAALRPLVREPFLDVPDPTLVVLRGTPEQFRALRIVVRDSVPGRG
jgi:hypothetical protein